jgi:hypothetical protein
VRVRRLAAAVPLVLLVGCRGPARELSRGPGGAAAVRTFVEALALRFGPAQRDATLQALRPKLERAALVPSRIFADESAWPERAGERRAVELAGGGSLADYRLGVRRVAAAPARPGEYRGRIQLQRTGNGRFQWDVVEELAVGPLRVAEIAAAVDALFREAEGLDGAAARAAILRAFPRATGALGRLLRLETVALWREGGGTRIEVAVRLVPEALGASAPRLARFVRRYFGPMQVHAVAGDASGRVWWTLDARGDVWTLRLRVHEGRLLPLQGPAEGRIPADLRVTLDYRTRMGHFRVGVRQLAAGLTLVSTPAETGFVARFLEEPDWDLPFLVEPLLHGPLHHPFEAPGSEVGLWAREDGVGTRLVRTYRARVQETFVLRWLSGLTTTAMRDFREGAEAELDAWSRECLVAIRDDLAALAG